MSDDGFFSKKDQRIMSAFIGQGLLFDYMTNSLDPERRKAVADYVRTSPDAQMDMQKIQNGLNYVEKLRQIEISNELLDKVTVSSSYIQTLMDKVHFDDWSPALKMGIEGTIVALGITTFAILIPWHKVIDLKFGSREVVLTEVEKAAVTSVVAESDTPSKEAETFPDEGTPTSSSTTTTLKAVAAATPQPVAQPVTKVAASENIQQAPPTTLPAAPPPPPAPEKAKPTAGTAEKKMGVLYRGTISVTNIQAVTPKLVEKVQELGGRKAGQVELGWFKGDSSYFHFTMPESRYEELQEFFKEYGKLTIQQEAHERVMPEGIRRIIITVYEKK
jgi:hypothetical protein